MTNSVAWAPLVHKFCSENITSHQNKPEFLREMAAIRSRWGKVQEEPGTVTAYQGHLQKTWEPTRRASHCPKLRSLNKYCNSIYMY